MNDSSEIADIPRDSSSTRIDEAVQRFRQQQQQRLDPSIEKFVDSVTTSEREELLGHLVEIQAADRLERREAVDVSDYLARFPDFFATISSAFERIEHVAEDGREPHVTPSRARLGRLSIGPEIGRGGVAVVYRATDENLNRTLAIKTLIPEKLAPREGESQAEHGTRVANANRRMQLEASVTAGLTHPGVPPVHDTGTLPDGRSYFCMRLIEGKTFAQILRENSGEVAAHLRIFWQVAEILASAHEANVIHRDLKPGNIMVGRYGEVQVMDWGMAKRLSITPTARSLPEDTSFDFDSTVSLNADDSESVRDAMEELQQTLSVQLESDLTSEGAVFGTLAYMPPEQAQGRPSEHDERTDVFALGALLFRILTGHALYQGESKQQLWEQAREAKLDSVLHELSQLDVDPQLRKLCQQCLAPQQRERPDSALEVARQTADYLRSAEEQLQQARIDRAAAVTRANEEAKRAEVEASRRRLLAALLGTVVALVLMGVGASVVMQWQARRHADVVERERIENEETRAGTLVKSLLSAPPAGVPFAIEGIAPLKSHAVTRLKEAAADNSRASSQRLHAALALAEFGEPQIEFLAESIEAAHAGECPNFVRALSNSRDEALDALHHLANEVDTAAPQNWERKARIAIVALQLGDDSVFSEMARDRPDPVQRTVLIDVLSSWHGDLSAIPLDDMPPDSIGAWCAGVSMIPAEDMRAEELVTCSNSLAKLYTDSPSGYVHSAAGRALEMWGLPLPKVESADEPLSGYGWHTTSAGKTMLVIDRGSFIRKFDIDEETHSQTVHLSSPFLMADRETSVGEFLAFINTDDSPADEKPKKIQLDGTENPDHPMTHINWLDVALYCNWLSRRENLTPAYVFEDDKPRWDAMADGYRLPTEAEWEHAARAGTTTRFSHGESLTNLENYATYSSRSTTPCGSKLPNANGLFDMHGNVHEWCLDSWQADYPTGSDVTDPVCLTPNRRRVIRGGSYFYNEQFLRNDSRKYSDEGVGLQFTGFSVVRTLP